MDVADPGDLSPRARRALPFIAGAIAIIVVTSLLYLRASTPPLKAPYVAPSPMATLAGDYRPIYDFVTPSLGWSLVTPQNGNELWIFRTTDGGRHWAQQLDGTTGPEDYGPFTLQFFDRSHGIANLGDVILSYYETSDGGAHWKRTYRPDIQGDVTFSDPNHAWVVTVANPGASALSLELLVTTDGGETWTPASAPPSFIPGKFISGVDLRTNGEGWAGASGDQPIVYLTRDRAESWTKVLLPVPVAIGSPPPDAIGVKPGPVGPSFQTSVELLPGSGVLVIVTDFTGNESIYESYDTGATWRALLAPPGNATAADLTFLDSRHWWAFKFGSLYKTSDGGLTWRETKVAPLVDGWDYGVAEVIDSKHAWATMQSSIIPSVKTFSNALSMTSDGGATWQVVNVPKPPA